jgi:hypothetical protein
LNIATTLVNIWRIGISLGLSSPGGLPRYLIDSGIGQRLILRTLPLAAATRHGNALFVGIGVIADGGFS